MNKKEVSFLLLVCLKIFSFFKRGKDDYLNNFSDNAKKITTQLHIDFVESNQGKEEEEEEEPIPFSLTIYQS